MHSNSVLFVHNYEQIEQVVVTIYTINGKVLHRKIYTGNNIAVKLPPASGDYLVSVKYPGYSTIEKLAIIK